MDKLQITLTLSSEAAPELLAYLRQIPGARERAFVFRLLAQAGLRSLGGAGMEELLPTPTANLVKIGPPATTPPNTKGSAHAMEDEQATFAPIVPAPASTTIVAPEIIPTTIEPADPLAILDVGALNDAMARFG